MKPTWEHREDGIAIHTHPGLHMADMTERALIDEVEELRERAETYREEREAARDMADVERKRADAAEARVKELEGALEKYGSHYSRCDLITSTRGKDGFNGPCSCGLDAALAKKDILSAIPAPDPEADARIDALMKQQPKRGTRTKKGGGT